jgi:hypothetical protein
VHQAGARVGLKDYVVCREAAHGGYGVSNASLLLVQHVKAAKTPSPQDLDHGQLLCCRRLADGGLAGEVEVARLVTEAGGVLVDADHCPNLRWRRAKSRKARKKSTSRRSGPSASTK